MKRLLLTICTLLCANLLWAQGWFLVGQVYYLPTSSNEVSVYGTNINTLTDLVIPPTVTYDGITFNVTSIESVYVISVVDEGVWGHSPCISLTSVNIPNTVTSIGELAFSGCSSLTSIDIPNSVTSIGIGAFADCSSLTSVTIPSSVAFMGGFTFENCYNLRIVNYNAINCSLGYPGTHFGCSYNDSEFLNGSCPVHTINIGDSVQRIPNDFFRELDSLTSVTVGNSVTSIGMGAFADCSSLTSVTFEENINLDSIEEYSFSGCSSLTSITIPNSVTYIGDYAFKNCSSLTSIDIPNSVTSIQRGTFANCSSLTSIDIPNSVTEIASRESDPFALGAFENCSGLTCVTFGENVSYIGSYVFNGCSFLQNITCLGTNPPMIYNNSFPYPNIATVTVPCGSLEAYSAPTSFWNILFTDRIEEDCGGETGLEDLNAVEISFFPNPTNSKVTFNQAIERIELMDLAGKTLRTFRNESEINIEQLPAGVYYLRLTNNEKQTLRKLIKE